MGGDPDERKRRQNLTGRTTDCRQSTNTLSTMLFKETEAWECLVYKESEKPQDQTLSELPTPLFMFMNH